MILEVKHLEKHFNGIKAVQNCDFSVNENEIVALIGPNGAGKTTVFNIITGLVKPDKGFVLYKKEIINNLPSYKIAKIGIARTFQLIRLFPKLSVIDNLLLVKHKEADSLFSTFFKFSKIRKEEFVNRNKCKEILKIVGLEDKAGHLAENLSYGQQKLLELARILATDADLILLDEPVAGVNPVMRQRIKKILLDLKARGKTILFIEHDMEFLSDISDKIIVLDHGEEIAIGTPEEIQKNEKVAEAYLGKEVKVE